VRPCKAAMAEIHAARRAVGVVRPRRRRATPLFTSEEHAPPPEPPCAGAMPAITHRRISESVPRQFRLRWRHERRPRSRESRICMQAQKCPGIEKRRQPARVRRTNQAVAFYGRNVARGT